MPTSDRNKNTGDAEAEPPHHADDATPILEIYAMEEEEEISRLPEGCVAHALSLTSPRDACAAAAVSSMFRSAADSDAVWEPFLPPDHGEILSRAVDRVAFSSMKQLFSRLCRPLLIDGGRKIFTLDKSSGKKCFMFSARELWIVWGDSPQYWRWTCHPASRFSEVAELLHVCWLQITGELKAVELSPKTTYIAYLIFQLSMDSYGFDHISQEASVTVGAQTSKEIVSLRTPQHSRSKSFNRQRGFMRFSQLYPSIQGPQAIKHFAGVRSDGWMELALGEFSIHDDGFDDDVVISLFEIKGGHWKTGLIVEGIELRPKI